MRIASVRIEGFRCIADTSLSIDDITILVGANGTGKSSVLRAVLWFFEGGDLAASDLHLGGSDRVSVRVDFVDLTPGDAAALGKYSIGGTASFWRTWSPSDGEKLTGKGMAFPPFEAVRVHSTASALKAAYVEAAEQLKAEGEEFELPAYGNERLARSAMDEWESKHPERLEAATSSATHLFGFVGGPRLAGRFDFVFVPAILDAQEATRDARGSLLARLVERSTANQERIDSRIRELASSFASDVRGVISDEHQVGLAELGERVTRSLQTYVPGATVSFDVVEPAFRPPTASFSLRVADHDVETDVTRQGHGFQRALIVATLQELAAVGEVEDPPAVFLAIEEPELFQHPSQARHFASVLASLPRRGVGAIQVAYATHSEYFVDAANYEQLRRFRKPRTAGTPSAEIASATIDAVTRRLVDWLRPEEVAGRIAVALRRRLSEAVFADAVILVEGVSDAGVLLGVADRTLSFDAMGVSVISVGGKSVLPLAHAILSELRIPVYMVFDADRDQEDQMRRNGRQESDIAAAVAATAQSNRKLLELVGADGIEWPDTVVAPTYAVFRTSLDDALIGQWPEAVELITKLSHDAGARSKSDEWYRAAASRASTDPPGALREICAAAIALRG